MGLYYMHSRDIVDISVCLVGPLKLYRVRRILWAPWILVSYMESRRYRVGMSTWILPAVKGGVDNQLQKWYSWETWKWNVRLAEACHLRWVASRVRTQLNEYGTHQFNSVAHLYLLIIIILINLKAKYRFSTIWMPVAFCGSGCCLALSLFTPQHACLLRSLCHANWWRSFEYLSPIRG